MNSPLQVYIDYKSPYAFIAKDPTYQLEAEFGIEIDWYPLTLNLGSFLGTARKDETGKLVENNRSPKQWLDVKYSYKDARRYAQLRGLTLKGTQKIWDSSHAGIGLLWAKQQGRQILKNYTDRVYHAFWKHALDIEDPEALVGVLRAAGATTDGFIDYLQGAGRRAHAALQDEILDLGYFGVPTYVIEGESYFGREHLPRVRWHLSGKQGDLPEVAYDSLVQDSLLQDST